MIHLLVRRDSQSAIATALTGLLHLFLQCGMAVGKANSTKHRVNKQTNTRKWKSFIFVQEKGQGDLAQRHFCTPGLPHPEDPRPRRCPWSQTCSFQLCSRAPGASSLHLPACTSVAGLRGRSKGRSPLWKSRQLSEQRSSGGQGKAKTRVGKGWFPAQSQSGRGGQGSNTPYLFVTYW